ncbi:properdin-like [Rhineura floridana]|uniref:properdin-like n=1 Tax=Rhineura floridana TaxID=261503 RepID=UPI002AC85B41|nr:properdin-like [Rhineura floridana]
MAVIHIWEKRVHSGSRYGFQLGRNAPCQACQVAEWSGWSPWGACSISCREGVQRRSRTCHGRASGGTCQEGSRQWEMQTCSLMACCPVVGGWSAWNAWSACSVTCLRGLQTRERTCTNPVPDCGGTCLGSSTETLPCDTQQICPTHGNWGSWGNWEACPSTCIPEGSAPKPRQQRRRQCNSPPPSRDPLGNRCQGDDQEHRLCSGLPSCPQDGNWGSWKPSSSCSVTCGVGRVVEKRLCDNPAPKHGGRGCLGPDTRSHTCNTKVPCPDSGLKRYRCWRLRCCGPCCRHCCCLPAYARGIAIFAEVPRCCRWTSLLRTVLLPSLPLVAGVFIIAEGRAIAQDTITAAYTRPN